MNHLHAVVRVAAIAIVMVSAGLAAAMDMRFPEKGQIAFVLHIADNWTATQDNSGNLILKAPDNSAGMSLSVIEDKASATSPRDDVAKAILAAANAEPFSKQVNANKVNLAVKLIVVQVAQTHVATLSIITTASNLSAAQKKAIDDTV